PAARRPAGLTPPQAPAALFTISPGGFWSTCRECVHCSVMEKQKRTQRTPPASPQPASSRPEHAGGSDAWRLDPSDVARHAQLRRRNEQVGPLGKAVRYGAVVLAL